MVRTGLQWFLTSTGAAASSHLETGGFVRSRPDVAFPDVQLHFLPSVIIDHGQKMGDFHAFQATALFRIAIIGNESVPKIIIDNTLNLVLKLQSAFC